MSRAGSTKFETVPLGKSVERPLGRGGLRLRWLDVLRPAFLVLTVLYWSVNSPRTGGIAFGFFAGLVLDVFQGPVLREHALALGVHHFRHVFTASHQRRLARAPQRRVQHRAILGAVDGVAAEHRLDPSLEVEFVRELRHGAEHRVVQALPRKIEH